MSAARWCDYGNHAFKEGAEGSVVFSRTRNVKNQWGGSQPSTVPEAMEFCPECAAIVGVNDEYTAGPSPRELHEKVKGEISK